MTPHPDDTIVALSSAPGPGRRAIVRLSGPQVQAVVAKVFASDKDPTPRPPPQSGEGEKTAPLSPPLHFGEGAGGWGRFLTPGSVRLSGVHSPLPADLYLFRGPHTYTGQDLAELHTVSSPPLVERLIADLLAAGARPAQPGEFTLRAFLAGKKDLPQAEAVLAVIEAGTDADLTQALKQLAGGMTQPLSILRDDLLNLLADVEAALDFVDEDIEFVSRPDTILRIAAGMAHLTNLKRQLDDRTVSGRTLRAALVGEPNAGKSSLFNALVGESSALVSATAGTTRDYLAKAIDLGGVAVELIDTAGWQAAADPIEEQAQRLGREQTAQADLVLWCVPITVPVVPTTFGEADVILVRTKADLQGSGVRRTNPHQLPRVSCLVSRVCSVSWWHRPAPHPAPRKGRGVRPPAAGPESGPLPVARGRRPGALAGGPRPRAERRPAGVARPGPPRRPRPDRRDDRRGVHQRPARPHLQSLLHRQVSCGNRQKMPTRLAARLSNSPDFQGFRR